MPSQIITCAPQARIVLQKKVTGPVPLECISGPEPPNREYNLVSGQKKTRVNGKTKPKILRQRLLFLVITPKFLNL